MDDEPYRAAQVIQIANETMARREFIGRAVLSVGALSASKAAWSADRGVAASEPFIQTVLGPIPASKLGRALVHEHVMCDFIGAEQTGRHRWQVNAVVKRMQPVLVQLKERGFTGFFDCTPAYIGRDPRVLKKLAEATGLHIVTNTGYYGGAGDKFVPKHAYEETPGQLADRWVREWNQGIEDTNVKPGFMKIGVDEAKGDPPKLSDIDEKIVRASARASKRTGLAVTCHTGGGPAGLVATRLFIKEGGIPARFIVAHSDGHGIHINQQVGELGAWVSFDAISRQPLEQHLKLVTAMLEKHADRVLLSHDNGWYWVGQENGGEVRDYSYISDTLLPALRKNGVSEWVIRKLTVANPASAFAIQRRS
jgi:predicted metal-dependent phosphotriesterase family hydrolase